MWMRASNLYALALYEDIRNVFSLLISLKTGVGTHNACASNGHTKSLLITSRSAAITRKGNQGNVIEWKSNDANPRKILLELRSSLKESQHGKSRSRGI